MSCCKFTRCKLLPLQPASAVVVLVASCHAVSCHVTSHYGCTGHVLNCLQDLYPIRSGVPQGNILGPTLFILHINDAEDNFPDQINMAVYADDTTLYATVRPTDSLPASYRALQSALEHMEEWGGGGE